MKRTGLGLIIFFFALPTAQAHRVAPSFCDQSKSSCHEVCQSLGAQWLGQQDFTVCCQPAGHICHMWGCFCEGARSPSF